MDVHYPIGELNRPETLTPQLWQEWLNHYQSFNTELSHLCSQIQPSDYHKTYTEDSWNIQQLAFHIADAHNHGFLRFRFTLTEPLPTVMPFDQDLWAELADYSLPIAVALQEFIATNTRWVKVLESLNPEQLEHKLSHPSEGIQPLWSLVCKHQWHVRHHMKHIQIALGQ